jgi:predicted metalloprotease with PDZ domain
VMLELRAVSLDALQALGIAPSWAGVQGSRNIHELAVDDGHGPMPVQADESTGRYRLARSPVGGRLRVSYFAAAGDQASRFDLHVDSAGVYGVGHAFLLVPELASRLAVRLRWDLGELGAAEAASSFGVGQDVRAELTPKDLARSMYLAGPLVVHEGGFGERLVVLGEPSFDTARAIRFCSDTLDTARRLFEPADREAFTFIFVPRPHLGSDHDGASLYRSFALWFDQDRNLDARLEILIAHELVHRWLGGTLRLVERGGADAVWFSEGFTTHYARSLLYRRGLIQPTDMLAEIRRSLEAEQAAHDPSNRPPGAGPGEKQPVSADGAGAIPLGGVDAPYRYPAVVHHGALYAALVEAELRRNGARSLDQLLVQLVERARASAAPMPVTQWRQALVQELGPSAGEQFDRLIERDEAAVDPPSDAFDRCFVRLVTKDVRYELGFDPAAITSDPPCAGWWLARPPSALACATATCSCRGTRPSGSTIPATT